MPDTDLEKRVGGGGGAGGGFQKTFFRFGPKIRGLGGGGAE